MNFTKPIARNLSSTEQKLQTAYSRFQELIQELETRSVPDNVVAQINQEISKLNATSEDPKVLLNVLKSTQQKVLRTLAKDPKLVSKNYYRNLWTALGMTTFGLPIGVAIGLSIKNPGLFIIGMPIGLAIGVAVGTSLDKKALAENKVLNTELS
ncbi:MAG: hypothetical protein EOO02_20910 [Chitinophagaceae bacterium]|nr:MAG: hypothetical protein EOO02_20910 [Chitinophagaceae bacterium]